MADKPTLYDLLRLMPEDDPRTFSRRKVLSATGLAVAAGVAGMPALQRAAASGATTATPHLDRTQAATPFPLPDDAAPADKQVFYVVNDSNFAKVMDFYEAVYERAGAADLFSEPLIRINRDFELIPAGAESWSGSEDGKTWTFKIRQGNVWTDGNAVTAADWVKTFQYGADPAHAWDFTWFFQGVLAGWDDAIAGKIKPEELGVTTGADEYELVIQTQVPAPYIPAMMLYSMTLSKAALESTGPLYNTKPETSVSSGPFKLQEFTPDQQTVVVTNPDYKGTQATNIVKVVSKMATTDAWFTMYQGNEIDFYEGPDPASLTLMLNDDSTKGQVYSGVGDFPTWYIFFDVTIAPWTDIKVRQAWSHAIDRDTLKEQVLGVNGIPAYSWLAPGFPAAQGDELKDIQGFDPDKAKQLLADAGFPDGKGFPKQTLWMRAPSPLDKTVCGALASMIKDNLNIDVELLAQDQKTFTDALNAKPTQIPLGFVRYGMDYLDPSNMLSVWKSGGRHSWSNPEFDKELADASAYLGDPAERIKMFQAAEKILVEDVPAVFVYHGTIAQLIKPWVKGEFIAPDKNGITSLHWPGFAGMSTVPSEMYIGSDAPDRD
jgi:ABC-type transport system substrate-binding protein